MPISRAKPFPLPIILPIRRFLKETLMVQLLKKYFCYSQFRPYQKEIIDKVLDGIDCLAVMATGSGKSLCYQVPPLVRGKTGVVISPLLALMQDQSSGTVPVKEKTVISYILEAARDGHEINWARFCNEIGLTIEIASQIRSAITKLGSSDHLKPIKEELPETVSYEHIKTCLLIEDLDVSPEVMGWKNYSTHDVSAKIVAPVCTKVDRTEESGSWRSLTKNIAASYSEEGNDSQSNTPLPPQSCETVAGKKQPRSEESLLNECSLKKLHKANEQEENSSAGLDASESSLLEWIAEHDGVH